MKLAIVSEYMLKNNYATPTEGYLKDKYGHKLNVLYEKTIEIANQYSLHKDEIPKVGTTDHKILDFLTTYSTRTRYFNLNELGKPTNDKSPLEEWLKITQSIYREYTAGHIIEKSGMSLMYKMDREGTGNGFTRILDFDGHPMMLFDIYHRQLIIQKSAPLIIWRIIELFQPIYFLLDELSRMATIYEAENGIKNMVIPHYEDFFFFFLAMKSDIKRRKTWMPLFDR
ncbi:hypothetical protein [Herbaspirillum huttiense]|uniref:hypothetical protein n=1 Tax=Herbaspirillum huttiense TaxID=863372 RepID=UPI000686493E|nr:hypothetical protein [Herbaspirillum huttiense]